MIRFVTFCLILIAYGSVSVTTAIAQSVPHVDALIKSLDTNNDGSLTKNEVAKNARYLAQFPRWDTDQDGKVSNADIVKFRAKFGIAADGTRLKTSPRGKPAAGTSPAKAFTIPDVESLARVGKGTRMDRSVAANSQFVLKTTPHAVAGDGYVVLTDHTEPNYLKTLDRFVNHHHAKLVRVDDLAVLHKHTEQFGKTRDQLQGAKYVAIAPRLKSFRENMVLGMWELLSTVDEDPQLDCFPAFLIASNHASFESLISQSIQHKAVLAKDLKPFAINQVKDSRETRSLQKSAILRKHFQKANLKTPIVAIYGPQADAAPRLQGDQTWNLKVKSRQQFVKSFSQPIDDALAKSNLIVMHGHGVPGMSCSMDVDAIPEDCHGKVVMSGSCFSANPVQSDLVAMGQAPGGYSVDTRDAFILRAIDNGAIVAFGHQRLSSGFPHLFPVLEDWTEGQAVGEAYQQLINGLIELKGTRSGGFVLTDDQKTKRSPPQQRFLYVVIGDPALQPFERLTMKD